MTGLWGGDPTVALSVGVLLLLVLESLPVGVVLPTAACLVGLGAAARTGVVDLRLVVPAAVVGGVAGDLLGVALGRRVSARRRGRETTSGGRDGRARRRAHRLTRRWGAAAVLVARMVPGCRSLVPGLVGAAGVPPARVAPWSVAAVTAWVPLEIAIGWGARAAYG